MLHVVVTMVQGAICGVAAGLTWWLALGTLSALVVGAVVGAFVGGLVGLMAAAAASQGGVNDRESMVVAGSLLGLATLLGAVAGLAVWLFRLLAR